MTDKNNPIVKVYVPVNVKRQCFPTAKAAVQHEHGANPERMIYHLVNKLPLPRLQGSVRSAGALRRFDFAGRIVIDDSIVLRVFK